MARHAAQAQENVVAAAGNAVDLSRPVPAVEDGRVNGVTMETDHEDDVADQQHPLKSSHGGGVAVAALQDVMMTAPGGNGSVRHSRIFGKSRGNVGWSSMLENIGLEMVQHYMEVHVASGR